MFTTAGLVAVFAGAGVGEAGRLAPGDTTAPPVAGMTPAFAVVAALAGIFALAAVPAAVRGIAVGAVPRTPAGTDAVGTPGDGRAAAGAALTACPAVAGAVDAPTATGIAEGVPAGRQLAAPATLVTGAAAFFLPKMDLSPAS